MVQEMERWLEINHRTFHAFFEHIPNYSDEGYYNRWIDIVSARPYGILAKVHNHPDFWYIIGTI